MPRRTKIVTTLGPATDRDGILEGIIRAGADMVRMNFSHGTPEDHIQRANQVREIAAKLGRHVAIMGDLQGPKIRVGKFAESKITLKSGDKFILDADCALGNQDRIATDKEVPQQQGLQGSSAEIADPMGMSPHPHSVLNDWKEITAWVKTVRSPRKPRGLVQADVDAGVGRQAVLRLAQGVEGAGQDHGDGARRFHRGDPFG